MDAGEIRAHQGVPTCAAIQFCRSLIQLVGGTLDEIQENDESQVFQQFLHDFQSLQEHASDKAEAPLAVHSDIERLKQEYYSSMLRQRQGRL